MTKQSSLVLNAMALLPAHIKAQFIENDKLIQNDELNSGSFTDGELCLIVSGDNYHFYVAVKNIHRKESLDSLLGESASNTLLICNRLTSYLADICTQKGLNFIDTAGNVRIDNNGLHLWIESQKGKTQKTFTDETKSNKLGEGSAKLLFALLSKPEILNVSYREMAEYASISLGMVSKGLGIFEEESLISLGKNRRILDVKRMLAIWVEAYRLSIRPKLGGVRLEYKGNWQDLPIEEGDYWGGEAAADVLTHYLYPQYLQLFTRLPLQKKLAQLNCRTNLEGALWLVPAFWGTKLEWTIKSQALLAVAELEASKDSRNIEVARMIYEKYL
ncbi:type IV toxin-antitoxin system AbiEi family antitoxin [Marinomonas sp. 15G1-11]|uniref:Type IV toxin-antitoxin system AbiEi family antitoxin n=1 Tax=Marinomonas phaeophyticola TaxID=3004091 RepID=A0ABT4JSM4_9GAMM|nr:type IV toxin-antitoxin system AbiEi family antitoxin [Marinomonas sp. 15G1-11]MCZ2721390.1 type IV toxin-antitoxin system AbiEi family antitoxin [Marinomonas sp. 15G1-11]